MHAVDTDIIVRYLLDDDPQQAAKARAIIGKEPIFIPKTVILEVEWVLRGVYRFDVARTVGALRAIAGLPGVTIEGAAMTSRALGWTEAGMDFADALHLASTGDCAGLMTFVKRFVRVAARIGAMPVVRP